jgi:hypothetical protein
MGGVWEVENVLCPSDKGLFLLIQWKLAFCNKENNSYEYNLGKKQEKKDMKNMEPNTPLETQPSNFVEAAAESGPDEINRLRDILFGSQTRSLDKRLGDLETRLETMRQELLNLFTEKIDALADSTSTQGAESRREFNSRLTSQAEEQSVHVRAVQKELSDRLDKQSNEQSTQLRAVQLEASDAVEKLAADLLRQIRDVQRELSERLDKVNMEQTERTRSLQSETRQRDDGLRQEFLSLAAALEDKKTSRHDLGQMLIELGLRVKQDTEHSPS